MELEKREIVWKFRVFPVSTSVDITAYQHGKNVLYFFYNIAQKNTKFLQWKRDGKFSVFIFSYVNMVLNQSACRIHKCYIIKLYIKHSVMLYYNVSDTFIFLVACTLSHEANTPYAV